MNTIVAAETVSAFFTGMMLVYKLTERSTVKSTRILTINTAAVLVWLLADIASYSTGVSYIPTLLTFSMGSSFHRMSFSRTFAQI